MNVLSYKKQLTLADVATLTDVAVVTKPLENIAGGLEKKIELCEILKRRVVELI